MMKQSCFYQLLRGLTKGNSQRGLTTRNMLRNQNYIKVVNVETITNLRDR